MFMLAAALFASCSDDDKITERRRKHQVILISRNMTDIFVYYGETYKTVKLANGTT